MIDDHWAEGYDAAIESATGVPSDVLRVLRNDPRAATPPAALSPSECRAWSAGWSCARLDLVDLLVVDGRTAAEWLDGRELTDAESVAIGMLRDPERPAISTLRAGLYGD
jgi:hypothetical protein